MKRSRKQIAASDKAWRILRLRGALLFLEQLGFDPLVLSSMHKEGKKKIQAIFLRELHDA